MQKLFVVTVALADKNKKFIDVCGTVTMEYLAVTSPHRVPIIINVNNLYNSQL